MGRQYESLDESLISWISAQPLFFIGTAPNAPDGHINISPKGSMRTFRILGPTTVAYLDLQGSGIETVAHLRENGRIVVMFCAFDGPPKIVRLHGEGRVVQNHEPGFAELVAQFEPSEEIRSVLRSIVVIEVNRISDSCGFVVPRMELVEERSQLFRWAENKQRTLGEGWEDAYRRANNTTSIDGLAGLELHGEASEDDHFLSSSGRAL
jgi:hypothetical protein